MSKNNRIILTPDRGKKVEGILVSGETLYPGMVVQLDPSQTPQGNRLAWKIYNPGADGNMPVGPYIVVVEDLLQGKTITDAYPTGSGTRIIGFIPDVGCELNLLLKNVAGTGDVFTAGDKLIVDDTTGKFIVTTGTPESEPALLLETVGALTADALGWCIWSGQ